MWQMTENNKDRTSYQRPLVIDISLLTRENDETYFEWIGRYVRFHRRDPQMREFALAPFPKVSTPICQTKEKFQWCCENIGVFNFYEMIVDGKKIWLFNHEADAAIFKLRWTGVDENRTDED
jgi:hypothetical protein